MMRPPRRLGLPRADRHRPNPAACLEPNVVDSKFVKYPSVVIVRGKTISGPQTVLSFTSPAAKINQIRCERSLLEFTAVSDECFHFGIFLSNVQLRRNNAEYFIFDVTTLKHTHKR